ncbi:hypothetical protein QVO32_01825 [Bacteroides gallinaceum]|uniref:hypothetical protein n=1 Tax=Bacteroides gallinaceum TaxID=1462571 RepID=UPI0025AA6DE2|nr:hypothetical protein [Bacteroides gallinaceum]MDN0078160.1 hypothetical protein [Bacteroides gallinaceum]
MKQMPFYLIMLVLSLIYSCENKKQSVSIDNLIVGKWKIVEYGSGYVNALDTLGFYKNGKADCPPETGEFTYRLIKPDSLIIYNKGFGEQHYKILKLSNDSLIKRIRRQRIYADSIDEPVNGEIEKYIRVTDN